MVQTVEEWLTQEIARFSERCVHENRAGCSLGLDWVELSGTKDRPHWKRPPNICFRPCLGAMKDGEATCEQYEKPTADAVLEEAIRREVERQESAAAWQADQERKAEREEAARKRYSR